MIQQILNPQKKSKGQILVMYALMLLVIIAVMGLALDVGYAYVSYARLRRAVDAAALNASNQIKEGYTIESLEASAIIFLQLNDVYDPSVSVRTCDNDSSICVCDGSDPDCVERKLVAVTATSQVPTFFMSVLGFNTFPISAEAESEAATIDVILVIDVSESMNRDNAGTSLADPWLCSELNRCEPFEQLKSAAKEFVDQLFFPYDRVGIVTFDRFATDALAARGHASLSNDKAFILETIDGLKVFSGVPCPYLGETVTSVAQNNNLCRVYPPSAGSTFLPDGSRWSTPPTDADVSGWPYIRVECPQSVLSGNTIDDAHCNSTNMGAGLALAGNLLGGAASRDESLWVVVVLADGTANNGYSSSGDPFCPNPPTCRLNKPGTRYRADTNPTQYDPVDYAFDMSDFLYGMEVYTFGIGLGPGVANPTALELMNYVIAPTGHPDYQAPPRGIYYVAPTGDELRDIFLKIANNIATRITR